MAWLRDARYSARALRANPAFTLAALLTMSIAIGATTAVFSLVNTVLLRPLPFDEADRIVAAGTSRRDSGRLQTASIEDVRDWRQQTRTLTALCAWRDWGMLRYDTAKREGAYAMIVTPELFQVFPAQPVLGRLFQPGDDQPGRNEIVLLTHQYWQKRFGADPAVVGKTMVLERGPKATYTIVGVLPAAFNAIPSFEDAQIFALSSIDPDAATGRGHRNRSVFARLRDGASFADAQAELDVIAARLAAQYPETNGDWGARVMPIVEYEVGPMADTLRAFMVAVGFVLLIACANVAGLQLVRALARRREFSIRQALGGGRSAIVRALVTESVLLSLVAGVLGVCLASWLVDVVLAAGPAIPRAEHVPFDAAVILFAIALSMASGVLLALPASLLTTSVNLAAAMKNQAGSIASGPAVRARMAFVAAQVALALMLMTGAVLAGQTLVRQLTIRPGFNPSGVAAAQLFPPPARYPKGEQVASLYAQVLDEARSIPGVRAASAVSAVPLSGEGAEPVQFVLDGEVAEGRAPRSANFYNVAPGYFRTLDVPIRAGRDFTRADTAAAPAVAIVNETFARRYLAGRDPLRSRVRLEGGDVVQIVGVAGDVLQDVRPRALPEPEIYWPYAQHPRWATFLVLRADNPASAVSAARERIRGIDPEIRMAATVVMDERLLRSARGPRFVLLLFGVFAAVAVLLSGIGVAGLVFYTFAQRTKEIAVRISLGASSRHVIRLIGADALVALLAGSVVGLFGTVAVARVLDAALRQLDPLRPIAVVVAWCFLVALGLVACYLPARRALQIDPASVLRLE